MSLCDSEYSQYNPSINETKIIQAITIKPFTSNIRGYLKPYVNPLDKAEDLQSKNSANMTIKQLQNTKHFEKGYLMLKFLKIF